MRLSVTKPQHRQLLLEIAAQLRSSDPKDALEHVLNCWITPCPQLHASPLQSQGAIAPTTAPIPTANDDFVDIEALASWD